MQLTIIIGGVSREFEVSPGTSVLRALQDCGVPVTAACGGNGTCGKCRVLVDADDGPAERLACRTAVEDGLRVVVPGGGGVRVEALAPHRAGDLLGLAYDIGTTTVVCHLHSLADGSRLATASCSNPQVAFGADVISRINASMEGRLEPMRVAIARCMRELALSALAAAGHDPSGTRVERVVVAGNTVMEHIACGLPPDSIGTSPFTPMTLFGDERALSIEGICDRALLMPCVAGYVGGDITAGLVATGFAEREQPALLVDVGTNGEMAVGCAGRMISCATAAGPAFEGANIACGMTAAPGAIAHVRAGEGRLELEVIGGIEPVGICGSALIDALAVLLDLGVVDETGRICDADELEGWPAGLVGEAPGGGRAVFLSRGPDVYLTQRDVRGIQLAKAAVCAGILTLLDAYGIACDGVDELLVAGAFGSHIDVDSAARIGLFPSELAARARSVGNAAGEGAAAVLVSDAARGELAEVAGACGYLELSTSGAFNERYVECMEFPPDGEAYGG